MKRIYWVVILSVAVLNVWCAEPFHLDELVVVGHADMPSDDVYTVVERIGQEEIARMPVANVSDVLALLPQLDLRSRGTSDAQTDLSMRGGTFDQVVVMLNGVPLQDVQTGHYTMNIPLSPSLIERIEVLQGPGADMPGALCGAVNIVTRQAEQDHYALRMSAGTDGEVHPSAAGTWRRNDAQFLSSVEYARSEGYYTPSPIQATKQNTDYQLANLFFQTRWRGLDIQTGAQYKDAGLGTGYGFASTDQFDATRTLFFSSRYEHSAGERWHLNALVSYRGQYDRYEWHRGTPTNRHWTHNSQASFDARYHWRGATNTSAPRTWVSTTTGKPPCAPGSWSKPVRSTVR